MPYKFVAVFGLIVIGILIFWQKTRSPLSAGQAANFLPHRWCVFNNAPLILTNTIADLLVGLSYVAITATLLYIVREVRNELPYNWLFVAFGLFIITCGMTHFMEIVTYIKPMYWLAADVKVVCAIASVATAAALPALAPKLIVMVRDLQERLTRNEQEYKRAQQAVLSNEKLAAIGRLSAVIAHEINNPLSAITGAVYILKQQPQNAVGAKMLDFCDEELRRIVEITSRTLRFQRESAHPVMVDMWRVVDDAIKIHNSRIGKDSFSVEKRQEGACYVNGYPGELRQVVSNLVANALDAMSNSSTRKLCLHVRPAKDYTSNMDGVKVYVSDSGTGLPSDMKKRLFQPFATTKGETGSGIGLWVSHEIVKKHLGAIHVHTGSKGTLFSVFIPNAGTEIYENHHLQEHQTSGQVGLA